MKLQNFHEDTGRQIQKRFASVFNAFFNNELVNSFKNENKYYAGSVDRDFAVFINKTEEKLILNEKPFDPELDLYDEVSSLKKKEFLHVWRHIAEYVNQNESVLDVSFFKSAFEAKQGKFAPARRYFMRKWKFNLNKQEAEWESCFIKNEFENFINELIEKINKLRLIAKSFSLSKEETGRLWNNSRGKWQNSNYDALLEYAKIFNSDVRLQTLARQLGRARLVNAREDTPKEALVFMGQDESGGAKAEFLGITEGNILNSILPSELALLGTESLDLIFFDRWSRKKLLCYEYGDSMALTTVSSSSRQKKRFAEGPFVICIDSSGSMRGEPERFAKAIVFSLLKFALKTKRLCYLISFSTEIAVLELSSLGDSLNLLIEFLSNSFYGGSQLIPALDEALGLLEKKEYSGADVLVVSDFILPPLNGEMEANIRRAQSCHTKFYAVLTGSIEDSLVNHALLDLFNARYVYELF
ncbi:MAG: hypothetical protein LBG79_07975 [Spirochaetaceae bacterium]|nr:hypothetical protein [Spirochaetaceae bacterium]